MSRMIVHDRFPQFKNSLERVLEDALNELARDVIIVAKNRAPFSGKGNLRADSGISSSKLNRRIWFGARDANKYARYQEFGGDGKRTVRNYTTPGTGAHYLKDAGDKAQRRASGVLKKHAKRARA